jgi:hypothetical protein
MGAGTVVGVTCETPEAPEEGKVGTTSADGVSTSMREVMANSAIFWVTESESSACWTWDLPLLLGRLSGGGASGQTLQG